LTTVLIVDDEAAFRTSIATLLQKRGFQTLEADRAVTALAHIADPGTKIELVLMDIVLPDTSGLMLADRVTKLNPKVKVLFMSGYRFQTLEQQYGMPKDVEPVFLQKPFKTGTLVAKIQEILGVQGKKATS
jgi:two-component system cell cycle sensor histidine kinase/response regulator CckA